MSKGKAQRVFRKTQVPERPVVQVLLVEDDQSYADLIKILLSANPGQICEVTVATTLQEGLAIMAGRDDLDAVLLDLKLPDSDGLCTLITVLNAFNTVNVIVLTGTGN